MAQEDKALLNEYVEVIFSEAKKRYDYDKNMDIYLPNDQENPAMRAWYVRGLDGRSVASAGGNLDDGARLLGVREQNLDELLLKIAKEEKITNSQELRKAIKFYKHNKELIK